MSPSLQSATSDTRSRSPTELVEQAQPLGGPWAAGGTPGRGGGLHARHASLGARGE